MPEATYDLSNETDAPLGVRLEPWGEDWPLAPGEHLQVQAQSTEAGELEVVPGPGRITLYAWPRCTLKVFLNGVLVSKIDNPLPALPPGVSMRKFIGALFYGEKTSDA